MKLRLILFTIYRRLVALKVGMGKDDASLSTEARILQHIGQTKGHGQEHIIQLFDLFTIKGPNGYHECFVTEVVVPLSAIDLETRKNFPRQSLNRQIAIGFDYLHSQKISHGGKHKENIRLVLFTANKKFCGLDPHHGNIGIAVPQISQFSGFDIMDHVAGGLEMSPVIPTHTSYPMETVPAYLVGAISVFDFLREENAFSTNGQHTIKILDFGRGKS